MANNIIYMLFGFFNIEFLVTGVFIIVYMFFINNLSPDYYVNIPDSALLSMYTLSFGIACYIAKNYFEFVSVFKTSDPKISDLSSQKKITLLLTGSLFFIGASLLLNVVTIVFYYQGQKLLGLYCNLTQVMVFILCAILTKWNIRTYLLILKRNSAFNDEISD